jgi:hypothetical protein
MSKPWNPADAIAQSRDAGVRSTWPSGATAGLAMLAAACVGIVMLLYRIMGPRDVFLS